MPGGPGNIIGELSELGKQIGTEAAKVPADLTGKALESLGMSGGKKGQHGSPSKSVQMPHERTANPTAWESIDQESDIQIKKSIARAALEELIHPKPKQREPSIWERIQMEENQKKEQAAKKAATQNTIPMPSGKKARGDLYGVKAKRQGSELGKNVKHD